MTHYPQVESNPDFAKLEEDILKFWQQNNTFQQSVDFRSQLKDSKNNEFIFYDGPPFANGLPHYGHLLTGYVKDLFARYQTMKGKKVERRFGWDCHGLPAEMGAEKELGISGRSRIMAFGIDKFNDHCRTAVMKYTSEWEQYVTRQARWVDFKNSYKTMDTPYMESVIWAFKELYNKGLVYEDMRVMPYSWACETPLSNFETRMDNSYRERADKAITVSFELKNRPNFAPEGCRSYRLMAWTTTPWTLPSNLALAVGPEIAYSYAVKDDICYIMAKGLMKTYAKELGLEETHDNPSIPGALLENLEYKPLLPYFANHPGAFRVLLGDFVVDNDGTGIVHIAPGFGEDDQALCNKHNIHLVCPVDNSGKFTTEVTDFAGKLVFDAIDDIIIMLKNQGSWLKTEQYLHNYPHCWRTDTPLIYKAVPSWYIEVTKFRDDMVKNNQQINWIPGHIKDGMFGKWLENARDWSISRNRFWGTPIPVWKSDDPQYPRIEVYGSIAELEQAFGVKVPDLHKPYIDNLVRPNPDDPSGKAMMRRVEDVFDCWFESGSMPYAQAHYPFENKDWFEKHFPADFIVEYAAQTRGWFYTLIVLSTALFNRPPFLNCICHGVILDEKGRKLSKSLNNYADPMELFAAYGADATRFLMISSAVMRGQELFIDKEGKMVRDVLRLVIKPIWNSYHFFTLYANLDNIKAAYNIAPTHVMDQYILTKVKEATRGIEAALDCYDTPAACQHVQAFFEILTNWYIRRNRQRFWKSEKDQDKQAAYDTLYTVLNIMCRAAAMLLPLTMENIYRGLEGQDNSVHLTDFPDVSTIEDDLELAANMDKVREICSLALAIRHDENIRTRMPLNLLSIKGAGIMRLKPFADLIQDEVNVKSISFSEDIAELAIFKPQIHFPMLGKRLPAKMKEIIAASKAGNWVRLPNNQIEIAGETLLKEECDIILEPKDKKGTNALSSHDALVILDLNITPELKAEGIARDIVRAVQQARKDSGLNVSDRITLCLQAEPEIMQAFELFKTYISEQTLAKLVDSQITEGNFQYIQESELEDGKVTLGFSVSLPN